MPTDPQSVDEQRRVEALCKLQILDSPPEARFDRLTREIAKLFNVPIAYIALIDADRQWLKSRIGDIAVEVARDQSFCTHTIQLQESLVVPDTLEDPRFAHHPLVTGGPRIRFYAGVPIAEPGGEMVGTVCIADRLPRQLGQAELAALKGYAAEVQREINALPTVFVSYAHEDEQWKDRLLVHCSVLEKQGLLDVWDDRRIGAGSDWSGEIRAAIERARAAVLLISADYLASDFIQQKEIPRLLDRRDSEGLIVFPLLLKPCMWNQVEWLARMNLRPRDGQPVFRGQDSDVDAAFTEFASELVETLRRVGRGLDPEVGGGPPRRPAAAASLPPRPAVRPAVGSTLGEYKLLSKLGSGGMGEVFLARDNKLKRKVALKVLKPELASDPERLRRFRREAEAVAKLNHPNIVTLYTFEEHSGVHFFTMELVEGAGLDRAIPPEGFRLDKFLDFAVSLSDALASAHRQGIAHRDLKAANVMVSTEGRIKILDFGLAKLLGTEATAELQRPEALRKLTSEGAAVGTYPYMSPEQIEAKAVDSRSDIFSLGIVLFEMLTGRLPFSGDSSASIAASILRDRPREVTELRRELPKDIGRMIRRCLEKDPDRRYQSAVDLRNELTKLRKMVGSDEVGADATAHIPISAFKAPPAPPRPSPRRTAMVAGSVAVALVALLAALWLWRGTSGSGDGAAPVAAPGPEPRAQAGSESGEATAETPAAAAPTRPRTTTSGRDAKPAPQEPRRAEAPPAVSPLAGPAPVAPVERPDARTPTRVDRPVSVPGRREAEPRVEPQPRQEPEPIAQPVTAPAPPAPGPSRSEDAPSGTPPAAAPAETGEVPAPAASPTVAVEIDQPRPAPQPDPAVLEAEDRQDVLRTLERFRAAYHALDVAAVVRLWPGVDSRALAVNFGNYASQEVTHRNCRVDLAGSRARASCLETISVVIKRGSGSRPPQENRIVFSLEKRDGAWIILGREVG